MNKIVELNDHVSPCINCIVKMCCTQVCNNFIIYYVSLKELIRLKLIKIGIQPGSIDGYKKFREIMLEILHKQKSQHVEIIDYIETTLQQLERSQNDNNH